jgi:glycosyltransferase involved in cell wall biosynthesis
MFGRWAAEKNARSRPDIVHCWSGIAEETLRACAGTAICTVARGSAHISTQYSLLAEEEARVGRRLEKPSAWICAREEREYRLAHRIIVPSTFARRTFLEQGIPAERVAVVGLALRAPAFGADARVIEQRLQRLRSGEPLRVLYTGMVSYRKGMHDLQSVIQQLGASMQFRLVGPVLPECAAFVRAVSARAQIDGPVPEPSLAAAYAWGDVFVLPSIEDGFAVVLAQAQAAGLPILTTTNCGGPDIIAGGGQGWIVPIRDPDSMVERLAWCDAQREELAGMIEQLQRQPPTRGWSDAADDFVRVVT